MFGNSVVPIRRSDVRQFALNDSLTLSTSELEAFMENSVATQCLGQRTLIRNGKYHCTGYSSTSFIHPSIWFIWINIWPIHQFFVPGKCFVCINCQDIGDRNSCSQHEKGDQERYITNLCQPDLRMLKALPICCAILCFVTVLYVT